MQSGRGAGTVAARRRWRTAKQRRPRPRCSGERRGELFLPRCSRLLDHLQISSKRLIFGRKKKIVGTRDAITVILHCFVSVRRAIFFTKFSYSSRRPCLVMPELADTRWRKSGYVCRQRRGTTSSDNFECNTYRGKVTLMTINEKRIVFRLRHQKRITKYCCYSFFNTEREARHLYAKGTRSPLGHSRTDACNWWLQLRHTFVVDPNNPLILCHFLYNDWRDIISSSVECLTELVTHRHQFLQSFIFSFRVSFSLCTFYSLWLFLPSVARDSYSSRVFKYYTQIRALFFPGCISSKWNS